jgi:hypothetical protein
MDKVDGVSDKVTMIVEEFFSEITLRDPFETHLAEFKMTLRSKLLEVVTSFPTDPDIANRVLNQALEGMDKLIKKTVDEVNLSSERHI